jgi:hypothetical protein
MKVAKEEIVGLVTALGMFVEEDEAAEMANYQALAQRVVDALVETPGLQVSLHHDGVDYLIPTAVLKFGEAWPGRARPQTRSRRRWSRATRPSTCNSSARQTSWA